MHRRHRGRELVERGTRGSREIVNADAGWTRDERERFGFAGGQAGEIGGVTFDESNAAAASLLGVHRHAHGRERVDVTKDRANRNAQSLSQLTRGECLSPLQGHENGNESFGAHVGITTSNADMAW